MAANSRATPLLRVSDLTKRYGDVPVVDRVAFSASPREVVGIIGPNGAGKTTLFNVITGLQSPNGGRIQLDKRDITGKRPHRRARFGIARTFQRLEAFGSLTARENVLVALEIRRRWEKERFDTDAEAMRLLEKVGIASVAERKVEMLPTGTARLVELARALATNPSVLLLDEPSSGLDVHETEQLGDALRRVRQERGTAFVLVEHNVEFVLDLSDRVTALDFGKLLMEGLPNEVRDSPEVQAAYFGAPLDAPELEEES
jgi:branched-chain amino acid transport system ATP-binding protein